MSKEPCAIVIHQINEDGSQKYIINGNVRAFVIDERAPNDRVYELTDRSDPREIVTILGDSPIGHKGDVRHAAIENKILAHIEGKVHLSIVDN